MPSKGMKKLRQVEKAGLIVLCIVMLGTLGLGTSSIFEGCGRAEEGGSFVVDGESYSVPRTDLAEYWPFMTFLRITRQPPAWKFSYGGRFEPQFADYQATDEDLWTFVILDKLAVKAEVPVPEKAVEEWIRRNFSNPETGRYERESYIAWLASDHIARLWPTAGSFEKFLMRYLRVGYFVDMYRSLLLPTSEAVYQQWSVRNRRHDVDYVVQSLSSIRREIDPATLPKEEVEAHYAQEKVRRNFRVPTRREFEAVYVVLADVTDEQFTSIRTKAEEKGLVKLGPQEGFQHYYANEPRLYPISDVVEGLKAEWEAEQEKKKEAEKLADAEKAGDAEKPADTEEPATDGEEKPATDEADAPAKEEAPKPELDLPQKNAFVDPTTGMTPTQKYETYFKEKVERELFLSKLLDRLLKDERIRKKGLESIATEWGLPRFVTEKGMDQYEIYSHEPVGGQRMREALNKIEGGTPYADQVVEIGREEGRGYAIWKMIAVNAEHIPELGSLVEEKLLKNTLAAMDRLDYEEMEKTTSAEALANAFPDVKLPEKDEFTVEEVVRLLLRQAKAEEEAKAKLGKVMEAVTAGGQTFAAAAEEKGYRVFKLDGVGNETPMARPEEPADGDEPSAEEEKKRRLDGYRWFLLKGRSFGSSLSLNMRLMGDAKAGSFVKDILVDRDTDAAFVVWVKSHREPGAEEMPEVEAGRIRSELAERNRTSTMRAFFEWEEIVERYSVEVPGLTDKPAEDETTR